MLWIDLKTSPLSFHSAQGGAGELRLQRHADPPPAVLLQRRSGGAGWGGGDHQIRSAQPEAPQPTRHRHPAQAGGVHLRLWVRLTQKVGSSRHYLLLSLLELCSILYLEHVMFSPKRTHGLPLCSREPATCSWLRIYTPVSVF